MQEGSEWF